MGGCVSSDDKKVVKPPPAKDELGGSAGTQNQIVSPNNINVHVDQAGRPLPSTPMRKGISGCHC